MSSTRLAVAGPRLGTRYTGPLLLVLGASLSIGSGEIGEARAAWGQDARRPSAASSTSKESDPAETLRLAHGLLRERKFDLAAEEYERFLQAESDGPAADDARFGLANARLFQGRYKEARQGFHDFLAKAPGHARARTARYRLGELAYMLGELPEARTALEAFVKGPRHPNLETAWTYLGDVCLGLDDLPAARMAYEKSLADFSRGQLADRSRFGLGKTLAAQGEQDAAAKLFAALARDGGPDWVDRARLQLARVQLAAGHPDDALKAFQELDRTSPRSRQRAEAALIGADALSRLNRSDEARALLSPLVAEGAEPVAPRAALALATLELDRSRPEAARKILGEAIVRFPRSSLTPAFQFRLAEVLHRQSHLAEAKAAFLKLSEANPDDPWADDAVARAAALAIEAREPAEALRLARQFSRQFPRSTLASEVGLIEAKALVALEQPREAVPRLERLLGIGDDPAQAGGRRPALSPQQASSARYDLALAYRATGQAAKADALLAGLTGDAASPVGADARFLVAQGLVEKGRFAEAIEPLKQYLASGPKLGVEDYALAHLAAAQLGIGRVDEATQTAAALAKKFPTSPALPAVRLRLAEASLDRRQFEPAAEQFRLVLQPEPGAKQGASPDPSLQGRAQIGLGRALWKLNRPAEAATAFSEFVAANKADPRAPAIALERAGALEAAGQDAAAQAAYKEVVARFAKAPEAVLADLARARLLARTGGSAEAAGILAGLLSASDRLKGLTTAGESVDGLMAEQGWALADAGKLAEADAVFAGLLKASPSSRHAAEARFHLAESANQSGKHREVVTLLSPLASPAALDAQAAQGPPAAAVNPILPLTMDRLGHSQVALGDWEAAAATFDRLVRDFPGHPRRREALYLRAEAALQRGRPEVAEPILAGLEAGKPEAADPPGLAVLIRGRHVQGLLGLKRWKDALTQADALRGQLAAGDPAIAELDFARGRALLGLARPDEARQAFQAVIKAHKGSDLAAQAHLLQGETYFHQERFGEALREFWNVDILYDAPRWQAAALLEAGKVYERLGRWSDAVEAYERLRARFPADSRVAEAEARLAGARKQAKASDGAAGKVF